MKNLTLLWIVALMLSANGVWAQQRKTPQNFYVQARMVDGKPVGKIIPGNQGVWYLGMNHGYTVSVAIADGNDYGAYQVVTTDLMPAPATAFANPELPAEYADAMRQMIYETEYTLPGKSFDDMLLADKAMGRMHFSYLLLSSYDPGLSKLSGLEFALPTSLTNLYKVKVEVNGYPSYTSEQILLKSQAYSDTQSPTFEIKQGDKTATLQWSYTDYQTLFVAFQIERSTDGKNFKSLGTPRIFNGLSEAGKLGMVNYVDSLPENYSNYWYRVRGYDVFGYLSKPGDPIQMQGRDMTPPGAPRKVTVQQVTPSIINLSWTQDPVEDLKGFQVIGSRTEQGEYQRLHEKLLAPNKQFFQYDISENTFRYYRVIAVDTARNAAASDLAYLILIDTIPPIVPTDLRVEIDSNRVVKLSWSPSVSADIKGYRIMKAYHPSNGFIPITPKVVTGLSFQDTVPKQRIDKNVYYQLIALDQHYNHSKPAPFVAAEIPDDFPPTSPLLIGAEILKDGSVALEWRPSSSTDVASYKVLRTFDTDTVATEIPMANATAETYTDTEYEALHIRYATYAVACIDSSGNVSKPSNSKRVFSKKTPDFSRIQIANLSQVEGGIRLEWEETLANAYVILIYRKENEKALELLARASDGSDGYLDKAVKAGSEYIYKIGTLEASGKKSPLSDSVSLKVK